jgi:glycosyltransferase involved in cell wall biosynthesis
MAMGKAIVASDIGWAKELIIDKDNGLLVNPNQHKLFANCVISLLLDLHFRKRLGDNAKLHCKNNFDSSTIAIKNIAFYEQCLKR